MSIEGIGVKIKESREKANLSQLELAKSLEINEKTLRSYEKGADLSINLAKKIANVLSVDFYWLIDSERDNSFSLENSQNNVKNSNIQNIHLNNGASCEISHEAPSKPTQKHKTTIDSEEELSEICQLIKDYATPKYRMEIKEKLLRFKELH